MKRILLFLIISLLALPIFSQVSSTKKAMSESNFEIDNLARVILNELNRFRVSKGLDTMEMSEGLTFCAGESVEEMIGKDNDKIEPATTQKHLKNAGATKRGEELTMKSAVSKGREEYKTEDVAKIIYNRWESYQKSLPILLNPKYTMAGIECGLTDDGKKVYVSAVFAGYDITNFGIDHKKELAIPYNTKSKSLKAPAPKLCKNCDLWRNYDLLQKGLYVENDKVYLKYPNSKELRRLLKKPKDGLAFDIVQRSQYTNAEYNIVDNNLYNKGIMGKVIYKDKLFKKNLLLSKDPKENRKKKVKGIEVELGKFNPKITGDYEINLLVIQNGSVCRTITRGYVETGKVDGKMPIGILPYPNTMGLKPPFEPKSESSIINFTIPFEKNKSEYKPEDIQPFLKALNEPDFIIDGLYIYAYSSIEGDSVANAKLQQKRGESVLKVLQSFQNNKILPTIEARDSWGLFLLENEDGKYADIVALGKQKAINKINGDKKLLEELEPILAKERFAQIILDVTYDVSGPKEEKFSRISLEKAIKAKNYPLAYKIMELVNKRIAANKYSASIYDSLDIEETGKTVGLINNKIYYKYLNNNSVDEEDEAAFERLLTYEPSNPILRYNKLFCQLTSDTNAGNKEHQAQVQQSIESLYGQLDSSYVNGLNMEWQFKVMESLDTLENSAELIDACITRIKSFFNIKDATWQNALKLSYVFARAKDYKYASGLLEPYLSTPDVNENLVFMYISTASRLQEKYYSRTFAKALDIAKNKNQERYCKLFGEPYMTFQVLENPEVKKVYQGTCPK